MKYILFAFINPVIVLAVHAYVVIDFCDSVCGLFLSGRESLPIFLLFGSICIAIGDLKRGGLGSH